MNIVVLLKQTFDTEEKILIENGKVIDDDAKYVINPYDEYAVEEAVKLKEEHGGEVTVVSVGPDRVEEALRTALAMGADKAIRVNDERLFGDEYTIAKVLAKVVGSLPYDIIIAGNMAVDDGSAQVGPRVAEELGIPHVSTIVKLEIKERVAEMERDAEGGLELLSVPLPVLVTAQQGLNEPRYPSLPNLMKAKRKPLQTLDASDLDIDPDQIEPKTELIDQYLPPKKSPGRILTGTKEQQAQELANLLLHEAKVV
jgi:electron transfer flavoprotein beta subunit